MKYTVCLIEKDTGCLDAIQTLLHPSYHLLEAHNFQQLGTQIKASFTAPLCLLLSIRDFPANPEEALPPDLPIILLYDSYRQLESIPLQFCYDILQKPFVIQDINLKLRNLIKRREYTPKIASSLCPSLQYHYESFFPALIAGKTLIISGEPGSGKKHLATFLAQNLQHQSAGIGRMCHVKTDLHLLSHKQQDALLPEIQQGCAIFTTLDFDALSPALKEGGAERLHIPPLKERIEDLLPLTHILFHQYKLQFGTNLQQVDPNTLKVFQNYGWPCNVTELSTILKHVGLMYPKEICLTPSMLPAHLPIIKLPRNVDTAKGETLESCTTQYEKSLILHALEESKGILTRAATLLGTTRRKLKYRMDQLGIEHVSKKGRPVVQ